MRSIVEFMLCEQLGNIREVVDSLIIKQENLEVLLKRATLDADKANLETKRLLEEESSALGQRLVTYASIGLAGFALAIMLTGLCYLLLRRRVKREATSIEAVRAAQESLQQQSATLDDCQKLSHKIGTKTVRLY